MKIILHAGLHKTGTSSIQGSLGDPKNNKILREQSILYPTSWPRNHSIPVYSSFCKEPEKYHINIRKGLTSQEIEGNNRNNRRILKEEVNDFDPQLLLLSGEDISVLHPEGLLRLKNYLQNISKDKAEIKVILYVRNPVSFATSAIQEQIKNGRSYSEALENINRLIPNLFRNRIDKFFRIFGRESVKIVDFEQAINQKYGHIGHLLTYLGLREKLIKKMTFVRSNESMTQLAAEIIGYINKKEPLIIGKKINPKRRNKDTELLLQLKGPKFCLKVNEQILIRQKSKVDVSWLFDNCGIDYSFENPTNNEMSIGTLLDHTTENQLINIVPKLNPILQYFVKEWRKSQQRLYEN